MRNIKKSTKVLAGSFAVMMMGSLAVSSVMAYQGDYSKQGPEYSPERHTAMTKAMDSNNYQAWSELMADRGRITRVINEDNFARFAEARQLAHEGDLEGADAIRQELGIRTSNGEKVGAGYGEKQGRNKGEGRRSGRVNNENRGQNQGGKFIDADGDRICDNL